MTSHPRKEEVQGDANISMKAEDRAPIRISILANNPDFIVRNGPLIAQHAVDSDIFVSIKFKFIEPLLGLPIRRHDIHFRSDPQNFVFGLEDYRHLAARIGKAAYIYLINDSDRADNDTSNDREGLDFMPFDRAPIISHLMSFQDESIFETITRYAMQEGRLEPRRLSTGLTVILHYALAYPTARILLLGFYEKKNRTVLKDGKILRDTSFHDFEEERKILEAVTGNTVWIH